MLLFKDFYSVILKNGLYEINNNCAKNIVLFGNCHVSTIGFYLNELLDKKYNIYMVVSYRGKDIFFTEDEKNRIWSLIGESDYFIYQEHHGDFSINASTISSFAKKEKIIIPNLRLDYIDVCGRQVNDDVLKDNFEKSFSMCKKTIETSNLPNFQFILDNYRRIRFFNTPSHPTHYILYLMSLQIDHIIKNSNYKISIKDYYFHRKDPLFTLDKTVILGLKPEPYQQNQCKLLGINHNSDYFDINYEGS